MSNIKSTVYRIFWILLAAGIVCGGMYLLVNSLGGSMNWLPVEDGGRRISGVDENIRGQRPFRAENGSSSAINGAERPFTRTERIGDDMGSVHWMGAVLILGNLGKLAAITALVLFIQRKSSASGRRRAPVRTE